MFNKCKLIYSQKSLFCKILNHQTFLHKSAFTFELFLESILEFNLNNIKVSSFRELIPLTEKFQQKLICCALRIALVANKNNMNREKLVVNCCRALPKNFQNMP